MNELYQPLMNIWRRALERLLLQASAKGVMLLKEKYPLINFMPVKQEVLDPLIITMEPAFHDLPRQKTSHPASQQLWFAFDRGTLLCTGQSSLRLLLLYSNRSEADFFGDLCRDFLQDLVSTVPNDLELEEVLQGCENQPTIHPMLDTIHPTITKIIPPPPQFLDKPLVFHNMQEPRKMLTPFSAGKFRTPILKGHVMPERLPQIRPTTPPVSPE